MGFMGTCCKSFIVAINTCVVFLSLGLIGLSVFLVVNQYTASGSQIPALIGTTPPWVVFVPLVVSVFVFIVSAVGCCIALEERKFCMTFYGVLQSIFGAAIVLSGVVLVFAKNSFAIVSQTEVTSDLLDGTGIVAAFTRQISDVTFGVFSRCCDGGLPKVPCSPGSSNLCYFSFNDFLVGYNLPQSFCTDLNGIDITCSNPQPEDVMQPEDDDIVFLKDYQADLSDLVSRILFPAGICLIVFGSLLFLASFGSWYIACCESRRRRRKH